VNKEGVSVVLLFT